MLLHQRRQHGHDIGAPHVRRRRDTHDAARLCRLGRGGIEQAFDGLQRGLRLCGEMLPVARDLHAARVAVEERFA